MQKLLFSDSIAGLVLGPQHAGQQTTAGQQPPHLAYPTVRNFMALNKCYIRNHSRLPAESKLSLEALRTLSVQTRCLFPPPKTYIDTQQHILSCVKELHKEQPCGRVRQLSLGTITLVHDRRRSPASPAARVPGITGLVNKNESNTRSEVNNMVSHQLQAIQPLGPQTLQTPWYSAESARRLA